MRRLVKAGWLFLINSLLACSAQVGTGMGDGGVRAADGALLETGGSTGTPTGTLPCEVSSLLESRCLSCHGNPPARGTPLSITNFAELTAPAPSNPARTVAAMALQRMRDTANPMPPTGVPPAAEVAAFEAWLNAGPTMGSCASDGGTTPPADAGPDPFSMPVQCSSNVRWTRGNAESPLMNPGQACIACHTTMRGAPRLTIAGTIYPSGHEPNNCNGQAPADTVIEVTDSTGRMLTLRPNSAGNFYYQSSFTPPYRARVVSGSLVRVMSTMQTDGDCNNCHTQDGTMNAPGRIVVPY